MRYGRAIVLRATQSFALARLVARLVGLAPGLAVPGVAQVVAQTAEFKLDQWTGDAHPS